MTQDEIIKMARQAQMPFYWRTGEITYLDKLEAFAKLVAQHEREACAKVCESIDMEAFGVLPVRTVMITSHCADSIRARGQA